MVPGIFERWRGRHRFCFTQIAMSTRPSNQVSSLERDPVCGMNVNPATAKHIHEHGGRNYYFCCVACVGKFKADPKKYLSGARPPKPSGLVMLGAARSAPSAAHESVVQEHRRRSSSNSAAYVCPMCPEVRESKPGACPSCGMALEADVPAASTRTEYTCPMHPEIVRPAPGSCPICGMGLEPRTVTAAANEDNPDCLLYTSRCV